jgi:hypothetical protein
MALLIVVCFEPLAVEVETFVDLEVAFENLSLRAAVCSAAVF